MKQPQWLNNAIFYEIYPQSFNDTNADGIGDMNGITEKLEYIKSLGCNAIWINPCFDSPFYDSGYDVADYYKIAPRYGTNEDARKMFLKAHKLGLHILFDLVPGHTSVKHPWFEESMKAEKNEYTDRYVWTDNVWASPLGFDTLRGISSRDGSAIVNFFSHQPALNYGFLNPTESWQQSVDDEGPVATLNEMINVMRFWLNLGVDGFRVDMAGSLVKGDPDQEGTITLWQKVRKVLDTEFPEAVLISEWGEPDKALRGGFHMDFLLHFGPSHYNDLFRVEEPFFSSRGKGDIKQFVEKYLDTLSKAGGKGLICIPSGNHDMERIAYRLSPAEIKIAFAFLLSMPGAPFIYYGDEIGMRYIEGLTSVEGGYFRTGSRTPMQWDSSKNYGFSDAEKDKLYLCQDESDDSPTVEKAEKDSDSILNEVRKLTSIRNSHPALMNNASIEFISTDYPLIYRRKCDEESVIVVINPSSCELELPAYSGKIIYSNGKLIQKEGQSVIDKNSAAFILE